MSVEKRVLVYKRAVEPLEAAIERPVQTMTQEEFLKLHASLTETLDDDEDVNDTSGE